MTPPTVHVVVRPTPAEVAAAVADRLHALLATLSTSRARVDVVLTGGSVASLVHRALATRHAAAPDGSSPSVRWESLHLWWGDERFVAADDHDRNLRQAQHDLLDHLPLPLENLHPFPAAQPGTDLTGAATRAAQELTRAPARWDLVMLGAGPDGHVASLFPDHEDAELFGDVVAVRNSPKPPPLRLSLSGSRLARTNRLWVFATGTAKADAVARARNGDDLPLAAVTTGAATAEAEVVWFLDDEAASLLTE